MTKNKALISKLLEKRGINKIEDLSLEEKATIDSYQLVLSGKLLTVEKIQQFCKAQIRIIETKFSEGEIKNDLYYKACLHVYLNLLKLIETQEAERESLERYLTQLINN